MPTYDFHCEPCNAYQEAYVHSWKDSFTHSCGAAMEKIWSITQRIGDAGVFPITTTHLTGKPETFTSQSQLNSRLKQLGMAQRDDASWVEEQYKGYNYRTRQQEYSSGRGARGQWF
jgi:hypothetical protein